jgi:hypothetical protein
MAITDNKIHIDPWEQLAFPDMEHASGLELGSIATKTARPEELPPDIQEDEQLSEADRQKPLGV